MTPARSLISPTLFAPPPHQLSLPSHSLNPPRYSDLPRVLLDRLTGEEEEESDEMFNGVRHDSGGEVIPNSDST